MMSVHVCVSVCMCGYLQYVKVCYSLSLVQPSVQFSCSVMSDSLQPHGLQHTSPSITNSWNLLKFMSIRSLMPSVLPFSFCLQSFPASGSFPMNQFFPSGGQSIGVSASASVFPMNIQD